MLRAFLCSAALLGLASIGLAADTKDTKDVKNAKNDNGMMATVQKVDAKNHTITVMMKDKNGKEEEKTLNLTKDVKVVDENGKTADADTLKDGDNVRVVERDGKLAEVQREPAASKNGEEATITNVDAKKGTITVQDEGQERQRAGADLQSDGRRPLLRQHRPGGRPGRVPVGQRGARGRGTGQTQGGPAEGQREEAGGEEGEVSDFTSRERERARLMETRVARARGW